MIIGRFLSAQLPYLHDSFSRRQAAARNRRPSTVHRPVEQFALRTRDPDELLPWSIIDVGVRREFLLRERERAREQEWTDDCRQAGCLGCGACRMADCEAG
ncbi:MAG: hypothetical protein R6V58_04900 [Planctomycetota bacterium]